MSSINVLVAREHTKSRILELVNIDTSNAHNPSELDILVDMKIMICMYNPLFNICTNGSKTTGQMELLNGIPTGKLKEVWVLNLIRAKGFSRQIPLLPYYINDKLFGYIPQVHEKCVAGYYTLHLDENEQSFYSQFIITEVEPTQEYIRSFL